MSCMTKTKIFAQNIISQGKAAKRNRCGGKILYSWCRNIVLYPPALNLPELL